MCSRTCLLESSVCEIECVKVTVRVGAGRAVATNKELDGRGGGRHTGEEESSERHCEWRLLWIALCWNVVRMLCGESEEGGEVTVYIQISGVSGASEGTDDRRSLQDARIMHRTEPKTQNWGVKSPSEWVL